MIPKNVLFKIIEAGVRAPSGENSQPWRVRLKDDFLELFNLPECDQSLYNLGQKASFIAHGAFLENMEIAASKFGYKLHYKLFPDENDENFVAKINFSNSSSQNNSYYSAIFNRATNRKPYSESKDTVDKIYRSINNASVGFLAKINFISDTERIQELGDILSLNEQIVFSNKFLHRFFFEHIRWTRDEELKDPSGFFVKTLELNKIQIRAFGLFKFWPILKFFNIFGVKKKVREDNAKTFKRSAGFLSISIQNRANINFVNAGLAMQKIWLNATSLGLSMQPLTGVIFLHQFIENAPNSLPLNRKQVGLIIDAYHQLEKIFGCENDIITLIFRIGDGQKPTARAQRFPIEHFIDK